MASSTSSRVRLACRPYPPHTILLEPFTITCGLVLTDQVFIQRCTFLGTQDDGNLTSFIFALHNVLPRLSRSLRFA